MRPNLQTTVGQVCDEFGGSVQTGPFGSQLHASDYSESGTPVVMPQDMVDGLIVCDRIARIPDEAVRGLKRHQMRVGDIVFSRRGDVSRFAVVGEREQGWLCGTGSIRIRLNCPKIDTRYLRRFLQQDAIGDWLRHNAKGVTMANLNTEIIRAIPLVLPPLGEQRRIVAILDQADALRRKRREAMATLNTFSASLLSITLREQATAGALTRRPLETLIRAGDRINYGVVQPGDETEGGVPMIRVENVVAQKFSETSLKRISPMIDAQYQRSRLQGDEILVACVGSIGAVALVSPKLKGVNIARAVARIPLDPKLSDRTFVAEFLRGASVQAYFKSETRTVAQPTLNIGQLCETPIDLPPLNVQRAFAARVAEIDALKSVHRVHLRKLDALFVSLQQRAMRGELADIHMEMTEASA